RQTIVAFSSFYSFFRCLFLVYQITKVATNLIWIHGERILIKIHLSIENFSLDIVIHYKKEL
ncbi:TPA: hypothetical protein ACN3I4_002531, partial [Enterococcus faecium]